MIINRLTFLNKCNYALLLIFALMAFNTAKAAEKPNFIFILADDQSYKALGAAGNSEISTPNIDQLAQDGTRFTHAHNMGAWNGAVCLASRAMFISGLSVWNAHKRSANFEEGKDLDKTWPRRMASLGYDTYFTGKWHLPMPANAVFDHVKHERPGMPNDPWNHAEMVEAFDKFYAGKTKYKSHAEFMPNGYNRPLSKTDKSWTPTDTSKGGFYDGGLHWSEVLKNDSIDFINTAKKSKNPFFMYLAFNAPHDPRQAPKAYQDMYDMDKLSLPKSWRPLYEDRFAIDNDASLRDAALAPFPRTKFATMTHLKEYYAIITHMDAQIGAIIDKLKEEKLYKNTYIVFTADHGLAVGEHGLFGKQDMYEHSIRAPFIIRGPKVAKNKKLAHNIHIQDAMATALDLAGYKDKDSLYFDSVMPKLKTKAKDTPIYGAYMKSQRMIKMGKYKLIIYPRLSKVKLFNLQDDPHEMRDLASKDEHKKTIQSLLHKLITKQKEINDPLDLMHLFKFYTTSA